MPTYEYECKKCFHRVEKFQSFSEKVLRKCPKCKSASLKRLIGSGGALIFKGSGFYINDYCKPKQKYAEPKHKEAESKKTESPKKNIPDKK